MFCNFIGSNPSLKYFVFVITQVTTNRAAKHKNDERNILKYEEVKKWTRPEPFKN